MEEALPVLGDLCFLGAHRAVTLGKSLVIEKNQNTRSRLSAIAVRHSSSHSNLQRPITLPLSQERPVRPSVSPQIQDASAILMYLILSTCSLNVTHDTKHFAISYIQEIYISYTFVLTMPCRIGKYYYPCPENGKTSKGWT